MSTRIGTWIRSLDTKRALSLMVGPGALALGVDAAISHFAGREMRNPAQLLPLTYGALACVGLAAAAVPRLTAAHFRRALRWVGGAGLLVGLVGTCFHAHALWVILREEPITLHSVWIALAVAPPLFAPAGFAGIGALVWALGNPRVEINVRRRPVLATVPPLPPANLPTLRRAA
ncbi:MAG TPA: hypothetical protein VND93_30570 [Myxococcales bacterium]|nr:hypothetical protein [Myxococcales bacterium]